MAAINYYAGLKRGANSYADTVVTGTSTAGTAVDVEVRMQIDNGSGPTGLTRLDVAKLLDLLEKHVVQGGFDNKGTNLPALSQ